MVLQQALAQVDDLRLVSTLEMCVDTREHSLGNFGKSPSLCAPTTVKARPLFEGLLARALPPGSALWTTAPHGPSLHPTGLPCTPQARPAFLLPGVGDSVSGPVPVHW